MPSSIQARYQGGYWAGAYLDLPRRPRRGVYGEHERILFWVKGEYLLVLDTMAADPGAEVRNVWASNRWSAGRTTRRTSPSPPSTFSWCCPPRAAAQRCNASKGAGSRLRGWMGHHGDDAVPAPLIEFRYRAPAVTAVLLSTSPGYTITRRGDVFQGSAFCDTFSLLAGGCFAASWTLNCPRT